MNVAPMDYKMDAVESAFGIGCVPIKVALALMEANEDVTLDENGETVSVWDEILGERRNVA